MATVTTIARNLITRNEVVYGKAKVAGKTVWLKAPYQGAAALNSRGKPLAKLLEWRDGWLAGLVTEARRLEADPDAEPAGRVCSWRELMAAYQAVAAAQFAKDGRPGRATVQNNVVRLQRILRDVRIGLDEPLTAGRPERIDQWVVDVLATTEEDEDGRYLAACTLRQARSVWARWAREPLRRRGIVVPAMLERWPRPAGFAPVYRDPAPELKAATVAGGERLKSECPEVWLAFALMRHCGMRTGDVKRARWDWLVAEADGGARLRWTPQKTARSARGRQVEQRLSAGLVGRLRAAGAAGGAAGGEWIVPGDRGEAIERLNLCMRQWGWATAKASYELRKLFVSEVYNRHGLRWAVAYSGDSAATIERYYAAAYRLEAPMLEAGAPVVG